jgi:hypothetical protein
MSTPMTYDDRRLSFANLPSEEDLAQAFHKAFRTIQDVSPLMSATNWSPAISGNMSAAGWNGSMALTCDAEVLEG